MDITVSACLETWIANDHPDGMIYCALPFADMVAYKYYFIPLSVAWIFTLNVVLSVLFSVKLSKILKIARASRVETGAEEFKLKKMVLRNYLLTIIGSVATLFGM